MRLRQHLEVCFFLGSVIPDLYTTLSRRIRNQNKFDFWDVLRGTHWRFQRIFNCLEIKMMFPLPGNCPEILQLHPPSSSLSLSLFFFPSGKDEAKTASSLRLFWKITTRRFRTPNTRAGTWLSHARAVQGRPPRPSSTRGRPTSWSVYPGVTCWVRDGRLMFFLSPSLCSLSASGLDIPIISARGAAEDWKPLREKTVDKPPQKNHYETKQVLPANLSFTVKSPVHFLPHFVDLLCNSLYWIVCKHWLSNPLVISNSDRRS